MSYTPSYTKPYENGWEDLPSENTPVTAEILDAYDDAFESIEDELEKCITSDGGTITGDLIIGDDYNNLSFIDGEFNFNSEDYGSTNVEGGFIHAKYVGVSGTYDGTTNNAELGTDSISIYSGDPETGVMRKSSMSIKEITEYNEPLSSRYAQYKSAYGSNSGSVNIFDGSGITNGSAISSSGTIVSSSNHSVSDYINILDVYSGQWVLYIADNAATHDLVVALYGKNKQYLGQASNTESGKLKVYLEDYVTDDEGAMYIRFSNYTSSIEKTVIANTDKTNYTPYLPYSTKMLCDKIDVVDNVLDNAGLMPISVTWESGTLDISGKPIADSEKSRTDFIALKYGETITLDFNVTNGYIWLQCEYNSNKLGLTSPLVHNAQKVVTYTPTKTACEYVKFVAVATPSQLNGIATFSKPSKLDKIDELVEDVLELQEDVSELQDDITIVNNNLCANNAPAHNAIYRGKYLGNALTTEQKAQISAGTFNDLYIGDYWTIGGVNYRIASFDYWLNSGSTNCTTHHVVIVPDTNLYNAKMNDSNTTVGAYVGSAMYTTNLEQAKTTINNAFGSGNILSHREYLANEITNNYENGGGWYDSTVELMNERMVYGSDIFHNIQASGVIPKNFTIDKTQLPLFAFEPSRICNRSHWWLRDVVSASYFSDVDSDGLERYYGASYSFGVRPCFAIKG